MNNICLLSNYFYFNQYIFICMHINKYKDIYAYVTEYERLNGPGMFR